MIVSKSEIEPQPADDRKQEGKTMVIHDEKQTQQELQKWDDAIQWYQSILNNPGVSQSAKDAARDMLKQAEKARREILSTLQ